MPCMQRFLHQDHLHVVTFPPPDTPKARDGTEPRPEPEGYALFPVSLQDILQRKTQCRSLNAVYGRFVSLANIYKW